MNRLAFFLIFLSSCGPAVTQKKAEERVAKPLGSSECSACSMIVIDQPSPRGQLIHRDGERAYFCSIGDLIHYLETPSPHGAVQQVFIEGLPKDFDMHANEIDELTWFPANELMFQVGVERSGIMGIPILAFPKEIVNPAGMKLGDHTFHSWEEVPKLVHEIEKR